MGIFVNLSFVNPLTLFINRLRISKGQARRYEPIFPKLRTDYTEARP